jgi:PIN domain nuclease of toxin-antitoxin system
MAKLSENSYRHAVRALVCTCAEPNRSLRSEITRDIENEISASAYEISLKVRKGKLPEAAKFESDLIVNIEDRLGFVLMPLEPESMMRAARFEDEHAGPPIE